MRATRVHHAARRRGGGMAARGAGAASPMPVIGYFSARSPDTEAPYASRFCKALEELGFAPGRDVAIEYRFAEGQEERLPALAAELVRRQVTMLVATDQTLGVGGKRGDFDNSHRVHHRAGPGSDWPRH